jgi:tetratricopeptide (TPR) repeat protein
VLPDNRPFVALAFVILFLSRGVSIAQTPLKNQEANKPNPQGRVTAQQSVVVEAHITPEESEEGKINDLYQPVYATQQQDCQRAVEKYRSVVSPAAEHAKFEIPKNKFLFLAYRGIGDCDLASGNFAEAEAIYQKLFEFLPVWPGTDDSDYPINYRSIGLARMGQQRWKDAVEPLAKAVSIFDQQIDRAAKSEQDVVGNQMADAYRMSQDRALNLLAVAYAREERFSEALALLERAYNQAITFHAPVSVVKQIVESGRAISTGAGNDAAAAKWSQRSATIN